MLNILAPASFENASFYFPTVDFFGVATVLIRKEEHVGWPKASGIIPADAICSGHNFRIGKPGCQKKNTRPVSREINVAGLLDFYEFPPKMCTFNPDRFFKNMAVQLFNLHSFSVISWAIWAVFWICLSRYQRCSMLRLVYLRYHGSITKNAYIGPLWQELVWIFQAHQKTCHPCSRGREFWSSLLEEVCPLGNYDIPSWGNYKKSSNILWARTC